MTTFQKLIGISALIIFAFIFLLFYWVLIRPSQIKTKCEAFTVEAMKEFTKTGYLINKNNFWNWRNDFYKSCLHRFGL